MSFFQELGANQVLVSASLGWLIAQILKTLIDLWYNLSFQAERLWGSGGMPSSHSSTVCAFAMSAALKYGVGSFQFAIGFIFAVVVMYDAMGVRRETGKQAKLLNKIMEQDFFKFQDMEDFQDKLKEFVGHTPLQVLMGAILGIIIALVIDGTVYYS